MTNADHQPNRPSDGRLGAALDVAADRGVLLGYTRIGYRLRRRLLPTCDPAPGVLRGRLAVVTGATSGLGQALALGLSELGATVVLLVRDHARGSASAEHIRHRVPGADPAVERCDMSDLDDVCDCAARLAQRWPTVDVLVHNAGVLPATRVETPQGHELTLATHVLGPLLLTELLRPALSTAEGGRVIWMSSGGMYAQPLPADDPEHRTGNYRGASAYAGTKRVQVVFCRLLAERYAADGIDVHSMHPGWVDTPGVEVSLPRFHRLLRSLLRSPHEGADTGRWLAATQPVPPSGHFWHDRRIRPTNHPLGKPESAEGIRQLWDYCATATGLVQR